MGQSWILGKSSAEGSAMIRWMATILRSRRGLRWATYDRLLNKLIAANHIPDERMLLLIYGQSVSPGH